MCGVAGYLSQIFKNNSEIVEKMLSVTRYRGPDEVKVISNENNSFGTNRLSIENIQFGQQPIETKKFIAGFNGEIFNYKSLIKKHNLFVNSNSEISVILSLFEKFNENFVNLLDGQFAIYIYDKKKKKCFFFRDIFGIRPLFFYKKNDDLFFCSEIKGILAVNKEIEISAKGLAQTCFFWTCVGQQTAFEKVIQLPPGNFAIWENNKLKVREYRKKFFNNNNINKKKISILDSLNQSIKSQIHGEVPHASYLSGGIDSVAMAFLLKENLDYDLSTYSISFDNEEYDESYWQEMSSNFLNTKHTTLKISDEDICKNFEKTVFHAETFLFRTAPVPLFLLSKKVSEDGFKVVFSGEGADEILLGYDIFFENRIRRFWSRNKDSKFRPELLRKLYYYLPQFKKSRYFSLIKDFYKNQLDKLDSFFFSHFVRWSQYNQVISYFNIDTKKYSPENMMEDLFKIIGNQEKEIDTDQKAQLIEFETLLSNYLLSSQGDRMSMANSVEGRYPYLGKTFTEKISRIPSKEKALGIKTKSLFRKELHNILPDKIGERPKVAYQAPEARSFFYNNKKSKESERLLDEDLNLINKENIKNLDKKIVMSSSNRLGFRENMGYIIAQSYLCLDQMKKNLVKGKF